MINNKMCLSDKEQMQLLQSIHNDMPCGSIWCTLDPNSQIVFVNKKTTSNRSIQRSSWALT